MPRTLASDALTATRPPEGDNWPLSPHEVERLFSDAPIALVSIEKTSRGVAGATKADVEFPCDGQRLTVKWKLAPRRRLDSWNNNPRKEIATYVVQQWFLDPADYVVPTVGLRCVPLDDYSRLAPGTAPTLADGEFVIGTLALWLRHTIVPDVLYDPGRFLVDTTYAHHLSNFNVLAYLVAHRDGRKGNVLVADTDANRRVCAVDNGISFGGLIYNFLTTNWNTMRVPAVRRTIVDRLRALGRDDLARLGTVADLAADERGVLRSVPLGPPLDPDRGCRLARGRVQLGLTTREIDAVADRVAALLALIDSGRLAVF